MGFFITTHQATFLRMPLALSVIIFGAFQLIEGTALVITLWNSKDDIVRVGARFIAIINLVDGATGVWSGCSKNSSLAFTAAVGYLIDAMAHIVLVTLRWIAFVENLEAQFFSRIHKSWYLFETVSAIISVGILILTCCFARAAFSYYQVVLVGGTGWERRSPADILEDEFGINELEDFRRDATMFEREGILQAGWDTGDEIHQQKVYI